MTRELVNTNIMIVIETDRKKITEENLIRCGREEFLEKGYAGANLRDICRRARVTTGAFYFSFENKEALLGAILDPVVAEYRTMMYEIAKREQEHPRRCENTDFNWTLSAEIPAKKQSFPADLLHPQKVPSASPLQLQNPHIRLLLKW